VRLATKNAIISGCNFLSSVSLQQAVGASFGSMCRAGRRPSTTPPASGPAPRQPDIGGC